MPLQEVGLFSSHLNSACLSPDARRRHNGKEGPINGTPSVCSFLTKLTEGLSCLFYAGARADLQPSDFSGEAS